MLVISKIRVDPLWPFEVQFIASKLGFNPTVL